MNTTLIAGHPYDSNTGAAQVEIIDATGQPVSTSTAGLALDASVQSVIDAVHALTAISDYPITSTAYDADDNLISIVRNLNGVAQTKTLSWDASGNLLSVSAWV